MQTKSFHNKKPLHTITYSPLLGYGLFENWCISAKEYRRSISVKHDVIWLVIYMTSNLTAGSTVSTMLIRRRI